MDSLSKSLSFGLCSVLTVFVDKSKTSFSEVQKIKQEKK